MDSIDLDSRVTNPHGLRDLDHHKRRIRKTTELYWIETNGPTPVDGGMSR